MSSQVVVIAGRDKGRSFPLPPGLTIKIGRSRRTDVCLSDETVSREHCELHHEAGQTVAVNLSANGTWVNNRRITRQRLAASDTLRLGCTELRYEVESAEEGTVAPPDLEAARGRLLGLVGTTLAGFAVERLLAVRGLSAVFQARAAGNEPVALKVLAPEFARDDAERQRFLRAVRVGQSLRHPNLVSLLAAGQEGPFCWLALEYVEGESLARLFERQGPGEALDWQDAHRVALHVGRGLHHAHSRAILHRNVTPGNILLRRRDRQALLSDLMLGRALEGTLAGQITRPGELVGELPYLAPERTRSLAEVDGRADLYGLGATVYHLLTGRPPFAAATLEELLFRIRTTGPDEPRRLRPAIPPAFEAIVLRLLAKDPEDRYPDAGALLSDLEQVAQRPRSLAGAPPHGVPTCAERPAPRADGGWLAHYRLVRLLGEGGMGQVFLAEDSQLGRPVALKVMRPEIASHPESRQRFLREARMMAAVKHDHVVTVYQVDQCHQLPFIVMEFLGGISLQKRIEQGPLPLADVLRIGRETASGLAAAHARGLIHRDVKPSNLWLEAPSGRVKILDFGLARPVEVREAVTVPGLALGTPGYMAPEQALAGPTDARADLYSLGCVLYELCAGRPPFAGAATAALLRALATSDPEPLREQAPDLPPLLAELIHCLLSRDPAGRPASADVLLRMFDAVDRHLIGGS